MQVCNVIYSQEYFIYTFASSVETIFAVEFIYFQKCFQNSIKFYLEYNLTYFVQIL